MVTVVPPPQKKKQDTLYNQTHNQDSDTHLSPTVFYLMPTHSLTQYFAGGAGAEGEIAKYLEKVRTITKLGYNFTVPSYRTKVDGLILRNLDYGMSCMEKVRLP